MQFSQKERCVCVGGKQEMKNEGFMLMPSLVCSGQGHSFQRPQEYHSDWKACHLLQSDTVYIRTGHTTIRHTCLRHASLHNITFHPQTVISHPSSQSSFRQHRPSEHFLWAKQGSRPCGARTGAQRPRALVEGNWGWRDRK